MNYFLSKPVLPCRGHVINEEDTSQKLIAD